MLGPLLVAVGETAEQLAAPIGLPVIEVAEDVGALEIDSGLWIPPTKAVPV